MAAASLSERRGGSFFPVCLSRSPLRALPVAMRASARDSNLAARHTRRFIRFICAPVTIYNEKYTLAQFLKIYTVKFGLYYIASDKF